MIQRQGNKESFEIDIEELGVILRAGWKAALLTVFVMLTLTVIYAVLQPKMYEAVSKFTAPPVLALSTLSISGVQGVDSINGDFCQPVGRKNSSTYSYTGFFVGGKVDVPCLMPSSVFGKFSTALKHQSNDIRRVNGVLNIDNDHGLLTLSIRAKTAGEAKRLLGNAITKASIVAQEYFGNALISRIDQRIVRLESEIHKIREETSRQHQDLIAVLELALELHDSHTVLEGVNQSPHGEAKHLVVRVDAGGGLVLELLSRPVTLAYLENVRRKDPISGSQNIVRPILAEVTRLEAVKEQPTKFSVSELIDSSISESAVEPNYWFIAIPGALIALICGVLAGFLKYLLANRRS